MFTHSWGLLIIKEEFVISVLYRWPLVWPYSIRWTVMMIWHDGTVGPVTLTILYIIGTKENGENSH